MKNMSKEKTGFKNILNPLCVEFFIINNNTKSFQHSASFPCGLSCHHNLVVTLLKNTFKNQKSNIRYCRDWKNLIMQFFQQN